MRKALSVSLLYMLTTTLFACASAPPPTERLTTAEAAMRGATEIEATKVPRASLHMKLAQEQIDKAKQLIQDGYNQRADLALKRAQADAELAIALSKEANIAERALQAQTKVKNLQHRAQ